MDFDITDIAVVDLVERIVAHNTKSLNTFARSFNVVLTQKLKATTDSKDHTIVMNEAFKIFFFIW